MKLSITIREAGRGKGTKTKFQTLREASTFIQEYWQGPEYCDGSEGFHTDYSTFSLSGFTLKDVGAFSYDEGFRDFTFADEFSDEPAADRSNGGKALIVALLMRDGDCHHFRSTPAYIAWAKGRNTGEELLGPWTDEEYAKRFGSPYVDEPTPEWADGPHVADAPKPIETVAVSAGLGADNY